MVELLVRLILIHHRFSRHASTISHLCLSSKLSSLHERAIALRTSSGFLGFETVLDLRQLLAVTKVSDTNLLRTLSPLEIGVAQDSEVLGVRRVHGALVASTH